jgi:methyl-accepting chemotaxis protein
MNRQLQEISQSMRQLEAANARIHGQVSQIQGLSSNVATQMHDSETSYRDLSTVTEGVLGVVSRFNIGDSAFDRSLQQTGAFRDRIAAYLTTELEGGPGCIRPSLPADSRTPIHRNSTPPTTCGSRRDCRICTRSCYSASTGVSFALAVDLAGYAPTHIQKSVASSH